MYHVTPVSHQVLIAADKCVVTENVYKFQLYIIIKVYNEFTYYKTFILLLIWVNTIQLTN